MKRKRRWRRLGLLSSGLVLAFCAVAWIVGGKLVAPANRQVELPATDLEYQVHSIESESGSTLSAWLLPRADSQATLVLLHPLRQNRRCMLERARLFYDSGFSILLIDFQAHGESPGEQITFGYLEKHDVRAAVEFARKMNPDHRIGVLGRSLGGAATLLAAPIDIDALVVESVYANFTDAVYHRVEMRLGFLKHVLAPVLLCQLQPRLGISPKELQPIDHVDQFACPILVAAGDQDQRAPIAETRQIFAQAREPKRLVVFQGARHEDLLQFDRQKYASEMVSFFRTHLIPEEE